MARNILSLTNDQVANLEKIKSHYQSQVTPLHEQVESIEKEIITLMQQTPANLIQIKSKIQEAEKYRSDLRYLRIEALENGRSVLSTQQQDQLKTLVRSRQGAQRSAQREPHTKATDQDADPWATADAFGSKQRQPLLG